MKIQKIIKAVKNDLGINSATNSSEFNNKVKLYLEGDKNRTESFGRTLRVSDVVSSLSAFRLKKSLKISNIESVEEGNFLPLKVWKHEWGLPQRFEITDYNNIKTLFGLIEPKRRLKHSYLWKQCPTKVHYIKKRGKIWVKIINWNKKFPSELKRNENYAIIDGSLCLRVPKNYIGILMELGIKKQFLLMPQKIKIDKPFLEAVGLLWGEMGKSLKGGEKRMFSFTNKRPELIIYILDFLCLFGITRDNINFEVSIHEKYKTNEHEIGAYWSRMLNVPANKIKIFFVDRKITFPGACKIKYASLLLKFLLLTILNNSLRKNLQKKMQNH